MLRDKAVWLSLMVILLFMASCTSPAQPGAEVEVTETPAPTPIPATETPEATLPDAVIAAEEALAEDTGVDLDQIEVISYEERDWSDSCLGLGQANESCAAVITPGYQVTLQAGGETYVAHSDESGETVRFEGQEMVIDETPEVLPESPEAVEAAREALAQELGIEKDQVELISYEPMDWPNACLGRPEEGEMCAEVITPGYSVALRAEGRVYEVRTDRAGQTVRLQETADPGAEFPVAVVRAQEALAEQVGASTGALEVQSFEQREWPDSCLGLGGADEMCAQVITPGWLVTLGYEGQVYEVRTDETGGNVRIAGADMPQGVPGGTAGEAAIVYERSGGMAGEVTEYRIYRNGLVEKQTGPAGPDAPVEAVEVSPAQVADLLEQLEAAGFFELGGKYVPENTCCDRFQYVLTVNSADQTNTITALEGTEGVPDAIWTSVDLVEQFIQENVEG